MSLARFCAEFGPYPWVRLVGLRQILATLHLRGDYSTVTVLQSLVRKELKTAADAIAAEGKEFFPRGNWSSCNTAQLRAAMTGGLMSVEKAMIVAKAAELACRKAVTQHRMPKIDVHRYLSIQASNCVVLGLEEWAACQKWPRRFFPNELACLNELERKLRPSLGPGKRTEDPPPNRDKGGFDDTYDLDQFILAVMEGKAITWKNASLLKNVLSPAFETKLEIKILVSRTSSSGLHDCNEFEAPFIGLARDELDALRADAFRDAASA